MLFGQELNSQIIFNRQAKALIRLRVCAGWSEPLPVAHTTLLEISCRGPFYVYIKDMAKHILSLTKVLADDGSFCFFIPI